MPHKTFFAFILPSLIAMVLFIALPIVSVVDAVLLCRTWPRPRRKSRSCQPFGGCTKEVARRLPRPPRSSQQEQPLGTVQRHRHLSQSRPSRRRTRSAPSSPTNKGLRRRRSRRIYNLPFYKALIFTLVFCFTWSRRWPWPSALPSRWRSTPSPSSAKGPVIFFSLLPMIITPLVGSLILYWMIHPQGHHRRHACSYIFNDPMPLAAPARRQLTWAVAALLRRLDQCAVLLRRVLRRAADRARPTRSSPP